METHPFPNKPPNKRLPKFDAKAYLAKIANIGHNHTEGGMEEWHLCNPCMARMPTYMAELKRLKAIYPEQFQAGKFTGSMEKQKGVFHKL